MASNPRWLGGRRKIYQQRFRALGLPCALCGRSIDYTLPYYIIDEEGKKHINKLAFVIDEKVPVSKWKEGGYNSPKECANDLDNLQPMHAQCNAMKGNKVGFTLQKQGHPRGKGIKKQNGKIKKQIVLDGKW